MTLHLHVLIFADPVAWQLSIAEPKITILSAVMWLRGIYLAFTRKRRSRYMHIQYNESQPPLELLLFPIKICFFCCLIRNKIEVIIVKHLIPER